MRQFVPRLQFKPVLRSSAASGGAAAHATAGAGAATDAAVHPERGFADDGAGTTGRRAVTMGCKVIITHLCVFSIENHYGNIQGGA